MSRAYNVVDADGHILEPLDLWANYIDPAYRDRAPRIVPGNNGKERLVIEEHTVGDGRLNITVPDLVDGHAGGEVWLVGVMKAATIAIARGENKGRTITYHNVARRWIKLGDWTGKANSWSIPVQTLKAANVDEAAILVQSGTTEKPKAILGATLAGIR